MNFGATSAIGGIIMPPIAEVAPKFIDMGKQYY